MDSTSLGVLTTLGIDILGGLIIALIWLILRKCRGDQKKDVSQDVRGSMTHTNIIFNETVFGVWSMKNAPTISPKSRSGSNKHNKPGTKTMHPLGLIQDEHKDSNIFLSTHTSKFFGEKDDSLSPLQ